MLTMAQIDRSTDLEYKSFGIDVHSGRPTKVGVYQDGGCTYASIAIGVWTVVTSYMEECAIHVHELYGYLTPLAHC